ncbi:unnamed protein product, partial [Closterium sp. Naga37s-1]
MWSRGGASVAPVGKPAAYGARAPMAAAAVPETPPFALPSSPLSLFKLPLTSTPSVLRRRAFVALFPVQSSVHGGGFRPITAHEGVEVGAVALNAVQRRNARVSAGDRVPVGRWVVAIATGGSDRVAAGRGEGERVPMGERGEGERVPVGERGEGERVPVGERGEGERVPVGERGEDRVPVGRFVPPPMNFELQTTTLEIDFHSKGRARAEQLDAAELSKDVLKRFAGQVLTVGQKISFEFRGTNFALTVILVEFPAPEGQEGARAFTSTRGLLVKQTGIIYEAAAGSGIRAAGEADGIIYEAAAGSGIKVPNRYCQSLLLFKQKDFNFEKLGIGGLDAQFSHVVNQRTGGAKAAALFKQKDFNFEKLGVGGGAKAAALFKQKDFNFEKLGVGGGGKAAALFKQKDFNFEKLGIGGLDAQFADIFRRAFASRVFPPHIISRLGITHVKGMLLHGPPGTGKTLIARQIGKLLNGMEPKVVNGPEILDKYVGAAEKNIRDLFADAEKDQKEHGDESDLHIIIFDEIDAICKSRGSVRDGTGVHDSIVNQLLTKIDGVESLNNILLIGMTNRKDMLDEALLRPGRLEVQIEIGLPDEEGRVKILAIHSNKMRENSFMGADVDLHSLAARTKNFSGAELEGLVKSAVSFALSRQTDPSDLTKAIDEDNIRVTMVDFEEALKEVRPAYGANTEQLNMYRLNGMLQSLTAHHHILSTAKRQVLQVRSSERTPLLTCLLEGSPGSGKTALAATIAMESGFPFVKMISAETMVGMSEPSKCSAIAKVFDDAYKSAFSIVILDDIERLFEYVSIGPRFSNLVLQSLLVLVKRLPPEGHKLYVIATTSLPEALQQAMHLSSSFNTVLTVPTLSRIETRAALKELDVFEADDIDTAVDALHSTVEE